MENLPSIGGVVERDIFNWLSSVFGFQVFSPFLLVNFLLFNICNYVAYLEAL